MKVVRSQDPRPKLQVSVSIVLEGGEGVQPEKHQNEFTHLFNLYHFKYHFAALSLARKAPRAYVSFTRSVPGYLAF